MRVDKDRMRAHLESADPVSFASTVADALNEMDARIERIERSGVTEVDRLRRILRRIQEMARKALGEAGE